jgi:uncharacterized protein (DUF362 family)
MTTNRRNFLKTSLLGGMGLACFNPLDAAASLTGMNTAISKVAVTSGDNRADMAYRALEPFAAEIRQSIGQRRVVLKPNNVMIDRPLTSSHVDTLEGILEFLKSIGKLDNAVIAESAANGPTFEGFDNYGYFRLIQKYPVKLIDLDQEPFDILHVFDEKDFRPHAVRMSRLLLDPTSYIISAARMKTHDRVVATLSLKNIVFGAPIKDKGFSWGPNRKPGAVNDKPIAHGSGFRAINYNIFTLARILHPHVALIDGFEGMEGNGPNSGTPVDHRVCVAGTDWLAADRVALELMGIDFNKIGYLTFCAQAGMGVADLSEIAIIGEPISRHRKNYQLNDNIDKQLIWM